jgi:hypothetical protein
MEWMAVSADRGVDGPGRDGQMSMQVRVMKRAVERSGKNQNMLVHTYRPRIGIADTKNDTQSSNFLVTKPFRTTTWNERHPKLLLPFSKTPRPSHIYNKLPLVIPFNSSSPRQAFNPFHVTCLHPVSSNPFQTLLPPSSKCSKLLPSLPSLSSTQSKHAVSPPLVLSPLAPLSDTLVSVLVLVLALVF